MWSWRALYHPAYYRAEYRRQDRHAQTLGLLTLMTLSGLQDPGFSG